jgi:hypothetical protein
MDILDTLHNLNAKKKLLDQKLAEYKLNCQCTQYDIENNKQRVSNIVKEYREKTKSMDLNLLNTPRILGHDLSWDVLSCIVIYMNINDAIHLSTCSRSFNTFMEQIGFRHVCISIYINIYGNMNDSNKVCDQIYITSPNIKMLTRFRIKNIHINYHGIHSMNQHRSIELPRLLFERSHDQSIDMHISEGSYRFQYIGIKYRKTQCIQYYQEFNENVILIQTHHNHTSIDYSHIPKYECDFKVMSLTFDFGVNHSVTRSKLNHINVQSIMYNQDGIRSSYTYIMNNNSGILNMESHIDTQYITTMMPNQDIDALTWNMRRGEITDQFPKLVEYVNKHVKKRIYIVINMCQLNEILSIQETSFNIPCTICVKCINNLSIFIQSIDEINNYQGNLFDALEFIIQCNYVQNTKIRIFRKMHILTTKYSIQLFFNPSTTYTINNHIMINDIKSIVRKRRYKDHGLKTFYCNYVHPSIQHLMIA